MQNEEKTANYIGEAVILLTADHLGIETEMLDTAKEVWRTKRLPTLRCWDITPRQPVKPARRSSPKGSASGPTASDRYST